MADEIIFSARQLEVIKTLRWKASEAAVIIVDMWDKTICRNAERRVIRIAPKINQFIQYLRKKGVLIVHTPSGVMKFYENTPERACAASALYVKPPAPINWREPNPAESRNWPVDDEDWCDDTPKCRIKEIEEKRAYPWTRQIESIEITPKDAISDNGQEIFNLFEQRGIKNIFIVGVHINRCVLGRPYGIRQMVMLGKNVILVRDLTDALYDPRSKPFVSHEEGTELLVRHVEEYWCPSCVSVDIMSGKLA